MRQEDHVVHHHALTLLVLAVALALFIPAPYVVKLMSPGFSEETLRTATMLTRSPAGYAAATPHRVCQIRVEYLRELRRTGLRAKHSKHDLDRDCRALLPVMGVKSLAIGFPRPYIAALALHVPAWRRSLPGLRSPST